MLDKNDLQAIQELLNPIIEKVDNLENKVNTMQDDVSVLKRSAVLLETDISPKVQILLENHSDLAKNVMVAKDIDERVGVLEFDVKVIKNILKSKAI